MSCIQQALKLKGNKPFLRVNDRSVIEGGGQYRGYDYLITFFSDHRCGYVAIPPGHPLDTEDDDYMDIDVCVHGGLTFSSREKIIDNLISHPCNDRWLGFDAIHHGDSQDFEACDRYGIKVPDEWRECKWHDGTVKDFHYMENECKSLIDQLIEMQP